MIKIHDDAEICLDKTKTLPYTICFINTFLKFFKEKVTDHEITMLDQIFWMFTVFSELGWEARVYLLKFKLNSLLLNYLFNDSGFKMILFDFLKYPKTNQRVFILGSNDQT